jgi:hypothetical protein
MGNDVRIFSPAQAEGPIPLVQYASAAISTKSSNAMHHQRGIISTEPYRVAPTRFYRCKTADQSVSTGNVPPAVGAPATTHVISALDVARPLMELKIALEQRKLKALTPYNADAWAESLQNAGLIEKYSHIPESIRTGFYINFPTISVSQIPPNKETIVEFSVEFQKIVSAEIRKGRYIGPMSREHIEYLIGPFQCSPFSIIPKPGRPGQFRLVQNFSFPHEPSSRFPDCAINANIDSDSFPTTWGTFELVSLLIQRLPPGSQVATRDVAEAYRTIPLHPSQWPGAVARISSDSFCIDTSLCFGESPSAGAYGSVADAGAELFRAGGVGPLSKWVDDHIFFRIQRKYLHDYNQKRRDWHRAIGKDGKRQTGGRLWFGGTVFEDGTLEQFDEDCQFQFADLSGQSPRSPEDEQFTYNFDDIDCISERLGIMWERSKDLPFASSTTYIGFEWNLELLTVSLGDKKKKKYLLSISEWTTRSAHTLAHVQKLYGKLLHACLVIRQGRAYLTGLEAMLGICHNRPFVPHSAVRGIDEDLVWWDATLSRQSLSCPIPKPLKLTDIGVFSDASSGVGIAIVANGQWRAWRLIPGWQELGGKRDIAWAEAVGFQLAVQSITRTFSLGGHFRVYGDNKGVVEGWWNGRSRNRQVNDVFKRIHTLLESTRNTISIHAAYVASQSNPADAPSRGIYPPKRLLLPPIKLDQDLSRFLVDATEPYSQTELRLHREGRYPKAVAKHIDDFITRDGAFAEFHATKFDDKLFKHNLTRRTL